MCPILDYVHSLSGMMMMKNDVVYENDPHDYIYIYIYILSLGVTFSSSSMPAS